MGCPHLGFWHGQHQTGLELGRQLLFGLLCADDHLQTRRLKGGSDSHTTVMD